MFAIRKIDDRTYDLFPNKGWDDWSRVKLSKHGCYWVAGSQVPHWALKILAVGLRGLKPSHQDTFILV